jgi:hypothetical protein
MPVCVGIAGPAFAEIKKNPPVPVVYRSAAGNVIQPTRTIIHNPTAPRPSSRTPAAAALIRSGRVILNPTALLLRELWPIS